MTPRPITLGLDAKGDVVKVTPELRASTHMHVIGGSGKGKSKFLESIIRQDILAGHGLCVIDWHGELYNNLVRWCAHRNIGRFIDPRKLLLLNIAHPEHILAFNPFRASVEDTSALAGHFTDLILRAWGATNSDEMPTYGCTCRALFRLMLETNETLLNAARLLEFSNRGPLIQYAIQMSKASQDTAFWRDMQDMKTLQLWNGQMLSTKNRLARIVDYRGTKRFMGLNNIEGIDLRQVMDEGAIVFVNLAYSRANLPREEAKVFASFFLNEFFNAGMERADLASRQGTKPKQYILYLDEFQEYINDDMAAMLDQVRKGGLHMVLTHQHMAHFIDNPRLKESVLINARIRAVFGGLTTTSACELADEMCLSELNERQIKKINHHITHTYREETRTVYSDSESEMATETESDMSGSGTAEAEAFGSAASISDMHAFMMPPGVGMEGWFETQSVGASELTTQSASRSTSKFSAHGTARGSGSATQHGKTVVPVWVPIPTDEITEEDWTLDEKRLKLAEVFKHQAERHCMIKLDEAKTQPLCVPFVKAPRISFKSFDEYEKAIYKKQGSLPAEEVDRLLVRSEQLFLERVRASAFSTNSKRAPSGQAHTAADDPEDDSDHD